MSTYRPLNYMSKEYRALRATEKRRYYRSVIDGRAVIIEHTHADGPGLWSMASADLYQVQISAGKIAGLGAAEEIISSGATEEEAIAKARVAFAKAGAR